MTSKCIAGIAEDGKAIFEDFVMICAKEYKLGFGGKNIPDIFWPSDDSISSLQEFIEELNAVLNLSKEELKDNRR